MRVWHLTFCRKKNTTQIWFPFWHYLHHSIRVPENMIILKHKQIDKIILIKKYLILGNRNIKSAANAAILHCLFIHNSQNPGLFWNVFPFIEPLDTSHYLYIGCNNFVKSLFIMFPYYSACIKNVNLNMNMYNEKIYILCIK